jgi:hypothetical protein
MGKREEEEGLDATCTHGSERREAISKNEKK